MKPFSMTNMVAGLLFLVTCVTWCSDVAQAQDKQLAFASPQAAVKALVTAVGSNNMDQLMAILGPQSQDLVATGDTVADKNGRARFLSAYKASNCLMLRTDGSLVLHLGTENWPFPIPLVKQGTEWKFDTPAGRQEILNRHIGINELNAIKVCGAYVEAQREYARESHDGQQVSEYAQRLHSAADKHNGLYWPVGPGEEMSPMGPLVAAADLEGYAPEKAHGLGVYQGYRFHILKRQGAHAAGGAYDYVINGHMVAGFALVAFPEKYGVTGVMTFIVNQDGHVFQADLGENTEATARAMTEFDPSDAWKRL